MSEKHTPGPWKVRFREPWSYDISAPDRIVVTVLGSEPDARLIAAAPELLEAVKLIATLIEYKGWTPEIRDQPAYKALVAAQFKAEGKEPPS